ncbi:MAG: hypothetical protein GY801_40290 [bacterium]|nr:hypothetical protein [bacterium]
MLFVQHLIRTLCYYVLSIIAIGGLCGIVYFADVITILRLIAILYIAGALALPLLFASIGAYQLLVAGHHTWRSGATKLLLAIVCLGMFVYVSIIEPTNIQIEQYTILHPNVTETITLIHISDIQSNAVGTYEKKIFALLQDIPADIILHTGDLVQPFYYFGYDVSRYEPELSKLSQLFRQLQPRYGIYNVVGDTELPHKISVFDEWSGVTTLQDESVMISTPGGTLNILGLTLEHSRHGEKNIIKTWINQGEDHHVRILMGHAPDYMQMVRDSGIDLCLAGHTHGGQIHLPFIGPLLASSNIPKSWVRGFKRVHSTYMNVSAGIGVSHAWGLPPMRFRCPPAITVIQIQPEREASARELFMFSTTLS